MRDHINDLYFDAVLNYVERIRVSISLTLLKSLLNLFALSFLTSKDKQYTPHEKAKVGCR